MMPVFLYRLDNIRADVAKLFKNRYCNLDGFSQTINKGGLGMISFIICLLLLVGGYFVYGKIVENTFAPDDRETPAVRINDGVDYVVMPQWKLFLVQLLNIAGLGPIFGALTGAL